MNKSALLGNPVDHSISPHLFKIIAENAGVDYGHIKINSKDIVSLEHDLFTLRDQGFLGVNITLPYKLKVIPLIDNLHESAKVCGAVNTIVFEDGKTIGYNTDSIGAIQSIEFKLRKMLPSDKVCVVGAGGAARAVISELFKLTSNIIILSRDSSEAKSLSNDISSGSILYYPLNDDNLVKYTSISNFVINTTPVGMSPKNNERIIKLSVINKIKNIEDKYFFDAVFNPYKTNLLVDAEKRNAKVCPGLYWMIFQAIAAFKLWTNIDVSHMNIEKINQKLKTYL